MLHHFSIAFAELYKNIHCRNAHRYFVRIAPDNRKLFMHQPLAAAPFLPGVSRSSIANSDGSSLSIQASNVSLA